MARGVAIMIAVAVLSVGCSPRKTAVESSGSFYDSGDLQSFLNHTAPPGVDSDYLIGVGDRLDVVFFVHKDLSSVGLLVRSDGRITVPYVGDVFAAGLTPMQLDSSLTGLFSEVLRDPNLSVIIAKPADKIVYVLGQVRRPGGYPFETKLSVLQALARAEGLDRGAKTQHVVVIRRDGPERIVGVEVDVASITEGRLFASDIWLRNYDIVYVPKTRLQSAGEFVDMVYDILYPPLDVLLRGWQVQVLWQQIEYLQSQTR